MMSMPKGRTTLHRKITPMSDNTLTEDQWLNLWEGLGLIVKQYADVVFARTQGLTSELHDSKITEMTTKNIRFQIEVDNYQASGKAIRAQSKITWEVMASYLDAVVLLREIDRDVCENCDCDKCLMVDLLAVGAIELVKMLTATEITAE